MVIRCRNFVVYAVAACLFSRMVTFIGIPSILNHAHYFLLLIALIDRIYARKDLKFVTTYLEFLLVLVLSVVVNWVKPVNGILDFLLILQPIILYDLLINADDSTKDTLKKVVLFFVWGNLFACIFESVVLGWFSDSCVGLLLGLGAGSHVSGAIGVVAFFYGVTNPDFSRKKKLIYCLHIVVPFLTDNKQSIAILVVAFACVIFLNLKHPRKLLYYMVCGVVIGVIGYFFIMIYMPALFMNLSNASLGVAAKLSIIPKMRSLSSNNLLFYLFGLGPGCSVSRLSQMLPQYPFLNQLCTISENYDILFTYNQSNYLTNSVTGSSAWMMLFSWAGILGDLGTVGVLVIVAAYRKIYKMSGTSFYGKLMIVLFVLHGCIFQWMDEPVFATVLISLVVLYGSGKTEQDKEMEYSGG